MNSESADPGRKQPTGDRYPLAAAHQRQAQARNHLMFADNAESPTKPMDEREPSDEVRGR